MHRGIEFWINRGGVLQRCSLLCLILVNCLVFMGVPASGMDHPLPSSLTGKELVLNGGFERGLAAWHLIGSYSGVRNDAGPGGGRALELENFSDNTDPRAFAVQTLHLPTRITAGTYSFDYRLVQQEGGYAGGLTLNLMKGAALETSESIGELFSSGWVTVTTAWQSINGAFTEQHVQDAQVAHDAGELVWLLFTLYQAGSPTHFAPNQFNAFLDNVSVMASGSITHPTDLGPIAYIGAGEDGFPKTVNRIEPDGSGRHTVWTHPEEGAARAMYGLTWKPDGSEIAFSSDHEGAYSAFSSDVYGIRPGGTGLRRITNPPSKAELVAGTYSTGTVIGRVRNNLGTVGPFLIYVQGAGEPVSVDMGDWGTETQFTISNVADMGEGGQYLVFMWSGGCREYTTAAVNVVPGEVTDTGTIVFTGACGAYNSNHITWKRDGAELGVDVIRPRRFSATGQAIGTDLFDATVTAEKPVWSPVDDSLLYYESLSTSRGIYKTTVGGDTGNRLVSTGSAGYVSMSWLPDGSGFVYAMDNELRQFLFAGNQDALLIRLYNEYANNPSVSGDSAYVVFERKNRESARINDIWILQRNKPNQLWALTSDGKSTHPDWARVTAPEVYTVFYEANGSDSGTPPANQTKTGGVDLILAANSGNLSRSGYTFAGWNTSTDGAGTDYVEGSVYKTDGHITLYAHWRVNQYTVTFESAYGSEVGAVIQDYGTAVAPPTPPTREGYTFTGWSPDVPTTMPAGNVTLTAQWTINQYTLTYSPGERGTIAGQTIQTVEHGSDGSPVEAIPKKGYCFVRWSDGVTDNPRTDRTVIGPIDVWVHFAIDIKYVIAILQILAGMETPEGFFDLDFIGEGPVGLSDALRLLRQLAHPTDERDFGLAHLRGLEDLRQLAGQSQEKASSLHRYGWLANDSVAMVSDAGLDGSPTESEENPQSHSRTNVQVEGVDEGDIIKTDGRRIYRIKHNELRVVNLLGGGEMETALSSSMQTVNDSRKFTYFSDLYLTDRYLVVVGQRHHYFTMKIGGDIVTTGETADAIQNRGWQGAPQTLITIYDLGDLSRVDEIEINGNLMTTRLIDDNLYVISNQYIHLGEDEVDPRPLFRQGDEVIAPEYSEIKYLPGDKLESFNIITRIMLEDEIAFDYEIFLGSPSRGQIYVGKNAVYLVTNDFTYLPQNDTYTYKGRLVSYVFNPDGSVAFGGAGEFQGFPINQFAMDEYDGAFRMVTTEGWGDSVKNRLFVFKRQYRDGKRVLERIGFLDEGIGKPRETVRSVRFDKTLVTIVTFEIIDPLYTIDLSDPTSPSIRAGLELTGFSTYQHPWANGYILGIGYETDAEGVVSGLKLSVYDVSDWNEPFEVGKPLVLLNGQNGWSYSEALHNHKAILIAEELDFIGFAISRHHWTPVNPYHTSDYLIFAVDPEAEAPVSVLAAISHMDFFIENETHYRGFYRNSYDFAVERAVYIGNYLYVVSGEAVTSHDMRNAFERIASLRFLGIH